MGTLHVRFPYGERTLYRVSSWEAGARLAEIMAGQEDEPHIATFTDEDGACWKEANVPDEWMDRAQAAARYQCYRSAGEHNGTLRTFDDQSIGLVTSKGYRHIPAPHDFNTHE